MISKLSIKNYKSIYELDVDCNDVNIFIGTNSAGKSSVIQSFLLTSQLLTTNEGLNGALVSVGEYEDAFCRYSADDNFSFTVTNECGDNRVARVIKSSDGRYSVKNSPDNNSLVADLDYASGNLQYLSCDRIGPKNLYEKNMSLIDTLGKEGEYAIAYLNRHASDTIEEPMCRELGDLTLLGQVNWWLDYITGTQIKTEKVLGTDYVRASYRMNEISNVRPNNIGAGISYIISVLIMGLSAKRDSNLIIENPEIHLHPSAQSKVCEFLYYIASNGRRVFVETHSDHIFNGFRVGISRGDMNKDKINLNFLYLENGLTKLERVDVGKNGRIMNQRKNLFDQFDIDLNRMLGLE